MNDTVRQCLYNDNPHFIELTVHTNSVPMFFPQLAREVRGTGVEVWTQI